MIGKVALFVSLAVAAMACALAGCGNKKKPAEIADAAPLAALDSGRDAAGPEAANELDVARYEDEVLVDHAALSVKTSAASALTSYPRGDVVATLNQGDAVVQLAERNGFYRVTFADSGNPSRRKMGWVAHFAFEDLPARVRVGKLALPPCSVGSGDPGTALRVVTTDKPRCAYVCKADRECIATGGQCEAAIVVPESGEITANPAYTTVCTSRSTSPDAGADGGKLPPSLFGVPASLEGKCPRGFAPAPKLGRLCYRSCKVDGDCPQDSSCKSAAGAKLCFAN